jgi:hypothetical protein
MAIVLEFDVAKMSRWYRRSTGIRLKIMGADNDKSVETITEIIDHFIEQDQGTDGVEYEINEDTVDEDNVSVEISLSPQNKQALDLCRRMSEAFSLIEGSEEDIDFFVSNLSPPNDEEEHFSSSEKAFIKRSLQEAMQQIKRHFHPDEVQLADIQTKIDYLTRKVEQLDRFNWKRLFVSTLVGIAVDLVFSTEIPVALLNAFKNILSRFFEHLKLLGR